MEIKNMHINTLCIYTCIHTHSHYIYIYIYIHIHIYACEHSCSPPLWQLAVRVWRSRVLCAHNTQKYVFCAHAHTKVLTTSLGGWTAVCMSVNYACIQLCIHTYKSTDHKLRRLNSCAYVCELCMHTYTQKNSPQAYAAVCLYMCMCLSWSYISSPKYSPEA